MKSTILLTAMALTMAVTANAATAKQRTQATQQKSTKATLNKSAKPMLIAQADTSSATSSTVAPTAANQTSTTNSTVQAGADKKWGAEVALLSEAANSLAWQDAEQKITGYGAVKYKLDKLNAFAIRQYGTLNVVGTNSKANSVSTGAAGNTMLVYNRSLGKIAGADEAGTLFQTRFTMATNDRTNFDIAALSGTLLLPYTLSPKWSMVYGLRFATGFNSDQAKNKISMPLNYIQGAYALTDKFQVFQQAGVISTDIRHADQLALQAATGVIFAPAPWLYTDFSVEQIHGIGSGAKNLSLYAVDESNYNLTFMLLY